MTGSCSGEAAWAALGDLPRGARLLGADLGTKTIGLALSDVERRIGTPLETIRRTKFTRDAERLRAICERFGVAGLILGLPLNMNGSEGPRAQSTRAFARNLAPILRRPIVFWDERLTTFAATEVLLQAKIPQARRAKLVDKMAAAFILQSFLDEMAAAQRSLDRPTTKLSI